MNTLRRRLINSSLSAVGMAHPLAVLAAELTPTPPQAEGPFYPLSLPLDKDNDLASVAGRSALARGTITHVGGRVLDQQGRPVAGVLVEIWQCNAYGRYHHEHDTQNQPLDPNFQGYGQFLTAADGAYRFRTIKPVAYPGRAPHIHFRLKSEAFRPLTTQMYVAGAPENGTDFLLQRVRTKARDRLLVNLGTLAENSRELVGTFDIILSDAQALSQLLR